MEVSAPPSLGGTFAFQGGGHTPEEQCPSSGPSCRLSSSGAGVPHVSVHLARVNSGTRAARSDGCSPSSLRCRLKVTEDLVVACFDLQNLLLEDDDDFSTDGDDAGRGQQELLALGRKQR